MNKIENDISHLEGLIGQNAKTCWDGPDKMPTKKLGRTKCQPQKKIWTKCQPLVGIMSGWHFVRLAFCPTTKTNTYIFRWNIDIHCILMLDSYSSNFFVWNSLSLSNCSRISDHASWRLEGRLTWAEILEPGTISNFAPDRATNGVSSLKHFLYIYWELMW